MIYAIFAHILSSQPSVKLIISTPISLMRKHIYSDRGG